MTAVKNLVDSFVASHYPQINVYKGYLYGKCPICRQWHIVKKAGSKIIAECMLSVHYRQVHQVREAIDRAVGA